MNQKPKRYLALTLLIVILVCVLSSCGKVLNPSPLFKSGPFNFADETGKYHLYITDTEHYHGILKIQGDENEYIVSFYPYGRVRASIETKAIGKFGWTYDEKNHTVEFHFIENAGEPPYSYPFLVGETILFYPTEEYTEPVET